MQARLQPTVLDESDLIANSGSFMARSILGDVIGQGIAQAFGLGRAVAPVRLALRTKPAAMKYCRRCHRNKPRGVFVRRGREHGSLCNTCSQKRKKRYGGWEKKTVAQRLDDRPKRHDPARTGRISFIPRSGNRKLGPMPTTYSERGTCPPACMFYEAGCYADNGFDRFHWDRVPARGMAWEDFLREVGALEEGTLWRFNEAGDLPGEGNAIDMGLLQQLARAQVGRHGFTFTHKPVLPKLWEVRVRKKNRLAIAEATRLGFVVNLSADSIEEADAEVALGIAPVVIAVPERMEVPDRTPEGHKLVACPAQTHDLTCLECRLCAHPSRKSIIYFRAHGPSAGLVTELVRRKRVGVR